MAKLYEIVATVLDNNGVRVDACTPETLGDYYTHVWSDRDAAEATRIELTADVGDVVSASTEYTIRDHEIEIPDGWYFLYPDGSCWVAVKFSGEKVAEKVDAAGHDNLVNAGDPLGEIAPGHDDVQVDEPLANVITKIVLGDDTWLASVEVCRPSDSDEG